MKKKEKIKEVIKEKVKDLCILCRQELGEATVAKDVVFRVCPNSKCPRFGLITVVYSHIREKKKKKESKNP